MRLLVTCTHSLTLATLYKGLFPFLATNGISVDVVIGDREYEFAGKPDYAGVTIHVIPMRRTPSPGADLIALVRWVWFLAFHRYDAIHVSTPKASLLAGVAARLTFNGPVVFVYRRRVYELMGGAKKRFYVWIDRVIAVCARVVVPISAELGRQLQADGIAGPKKIRLLGTGSSNGIDADHFTRDAAADLAGAALRRELDIPASAPLLLFLGRVCSEKGVDDLKDVFERVVEARADVYLLVAGPDDARDPIAAETLAFFAGHPHVRRLGFVSDTKPLYAAADMFVFPSFFEGFGNVLLEAASMGRPAIGYDVSGVREAVSAGETGFLVPRGDTGAMADRALVLLGDPALAAQMGAAGRARVDALFRRDLIWREILALLRDMAPAARTQPPVTGKAAMR
jgi:glycosyltransferase involved in cell wall biosynthesis